MTVEFLLDLNQKNKQTTKRDLIVPDSFQNPDFKH
jgi:hypothetical protein